ncbi:MAG: tRNA (guanosine(37)-N1)-methyltransferase TrmD, partial [Armatimonadota bacterium]
VRGQVEFALATPRDFAYDPHRKVDDVPYGGHAGMLMRAEPVALALASLQMPAGGAVIVTEPGGRVLDAALVRELAAYESVAIVCGHYEGIDHRFEEEFATHVVSLGDFVLTGGEVVAMVIADALTRQVPGVLGSEESLAADSFTRAAEVSAPNYTRPAVWRGREVPGVLASGDHAAVARWREEESHRRSRRRPLVTRGDLRERFRYDGWANACLLPLGDQLGGRAGEVADHIRASQRRWQERIGGEESWADMVESVALDARVIYHDSQGAEWERTFVEIASHVGNHGTYHRGQLRQLLEEAGVDFPDTDWIRWRDAGSPSVP